MMTLTVYIGGLAYVLATDELAPMMTEPCGAIKEIFLELRRSE
jgi:hypothetical protein